VCIFFSWKFIFFFNDLNTSLIEELRQAVTKEVKLTSKLSCDILVCYPDYQTKTIALLYAVITGIPVVSEDFLKDSIHLGELLDPTLYLPGMVRLIKKPPKLLEGLVVAVHPSVSSKQKIMEQKKLLVALGAKLAQANDNIDYVIRGRKNWNATIHEKAFKAAGYGPVTFWRSYTWLKGCVMGCRIIPEDIDCGMTAAERREQQRANRKLRNKVETPLIQPKISEFFGTPAQRLAGIRRRRLVRRLHQHRNRLMPTEQPTVIDCDDEVAGVGEKRTRDQLEPIHDDLEIDVDQLSPKRKRRRKV